MSVLLIGEINAKALVDLLARFGLQVQFVKKDEPIAGSYWGEPEAGLIANNLYVRADTPVHSALHEACHWICMDDKRKKTVHTDAKGSVMEECAVNYLQILLADELAEMGRERMLEDMTAWGYSYREGDVRAWLAGDAADARQWLLNAEIIDADDKVNNLKCSLNKPMAYWG